jgi:hypothetical protein
LLARLDGSVLLDALPLWVGTVSDIEDLLPATPGLFDLVIVDEAAHIDQPSAAPALLRARRAVVAGDPHQLRHVTFRSDAEIAETAEALGLADVADRLDLRRVSTFDLAASAAPVEMLTEHFRSVPHLIGFSAQRFYADRLQVVTRHPRNESLDVIDVVRVDVDGPVGADSGRAPRAQGRGGTVVEEVVEVERILTELLERGERSVGVVTPFRPQADALEAAILGRFSAAEIAAMQLAVGTVHRFQGGERDVMVLSLGLRDGDPVGRFRFVEDPNLFNVMVTRARSHMIVVTALRQPPQGLVADYLRYADEPPAPPRGTAPTGWEASIAAALAARGVVVRSGYPVGAWLVDLCVGTGDESMAIECGPHPDGSRAHLERRRVLHRAGWRQLAVFERWWAGDADAAAGHVLSVLASPSPPDHPPLIPGATSLGGLDGLGQGTARQ